jgi:hypothetical protein
LINDDDEAIKVYEDNNACITIAKGKGTRKIRHIPVKLHYVQELVEEKVIELELIV